MDKLSLVTSKGASGQNHAAWEEMFGWARCLQQQPPASANLRRTPQFPNQHSSTYRTGKGNFLAPPIAVLVSAGLRSRHDARPTGRVDEKSDLRRRRTTATSSTR
uniref:Uncharacterized protein n=1 Tax=Schistocephalus solidus TaxID=70667 RepID=A0A0X3P3P0_SCHSO